MNQVNSKHDLSFYQSFRAATLTEKIITLLAILFFHEWMLEAWIQNAAVRRKYRFMRTTME